MTAMDDGSAFDEAERLIRGPARAEHGFAIDPLGVDDDVDVALGDEVVTRIDLELRADAARRLNRAIARMDCFLLREESCRLGAADPTRTLGRQLSDEGRRWLRGALNEPAAPLRESTLRSAYRLASALANLAAWSAPATQESAALYSYPHVAARDEVSYARYGCAETTAQEVAYTALLGFDASQARLLLTSSGMAAYALIENFLLRDVFRPADRVVLHPGVYFETQQQLRSLPFLDVKTAAGGGRTDLLNAIALHQPRVVLVDPLTNSADLRVLDLAQLLDEADRTCERETWFVIDGTLLSGGLDPFAGPHRRHVRVLYYESGCKYLQFGMDLGPAGVVVVEASLAERFERLRRGIGAVASEMLVLPRASRGTYLAYLQAQTACAGAVAQAVTDYLPMHRASPLRAVFPSQASHPDHAEAQCYPHLGGVLAFRFADDHLNRRKPLEAYIDNLISMARTHGVPLTAGVSFGFRVPRIGAAWTSYEADDAFLRLSAGVYLDRAAQLGRLIAQCAVQFATAAARCR